MPESLKRGLLGGSVWVMLGKGLTAATSLGVHALLSRLLTPEEFGVYFKTYNLVILSALAAQLGLQQTVVRLVAESMGTGRTARARAAVVAVYRYALFGVAGTTALLALGPGGWLAGGLLNAPLLVMSMGGVAAWTSVLSYQVITSETFRGFKDLRLASLFGGVITGLLVFLSLLGLWLLQRSTSLSDVIWISAGAALISLFVALRFLKRKLRPLKRGGSIARDELWPIAVPLWINGVLTQLLTQADIWILTAYIGNEQIAIYGAAAFMVAFVSQPLILVNLVVPPYIADLYARGEPQRLERILRQTATLAGLPALLLLLAFVFFGGPILGLVYPDYIRAAAPMLAILSVGKVVNVLTGSCGVTMMMTGHQRVLLVITIATGVLTVVGCLVLVGPYGMVGVAGAVSTGTAIKNIAMWLETKRRTGMWTHVAVPKPEEVRSLLRGLRSRT